MVQKEYMLDEEIDAIRQENWTRIVKEVFWEKRAQKPKEPMRVTRQNGDTHCVDDGADDTAPDKTWKYYVEHKDAGHQLLIWTRVYSNDVTHHELYCLSCGHSKVGSMPKAQTGEDFVLYFGKHRGKRASEVPRDYLVWCSKNLQEKMSAKIKAYLDHTSTRS
jgi:hypothetical protein